jgi:hypothetical protein
MPGLIPHTNKQSGHRNALQRREPKRSSILALNNFDVLGFRFRL